MVPITLLEAGIELPIPAWGFFAIPFAIFVILLLFLLTVAGGRPHSK